MAGRKAAAEPLRISREEAAGRLGVSVKTVGRLLDRGHLTNLTPPAERGRGRAVWIDPGEVEAYCYGGKRAAEAYRAQHRERFRRCGRRD